MVAEDEDEDDDRRIQCRQNRSGQPVRACTPVQKQSKNEAMDWVDNDLESVTQVVRVTSVVRLPGNHDMLPNTEIRIHF